MRVTPRSSRNEVIGLADGMLRVRLTAAPVDNAANHALVTMLADYFGVPKSQLTIVAGSSRRSKKVLVGGVTASAVESRIAST